MSSMIIPSPTPEIAEPAIVSGPFWPNIEPSQIRLMQRIDNTITPIRLRHTLIEAISTTNGALREWRQVQIDQGITKLVDIPAEQIDSVSILAHRYIRAIGCLTKALLLERYRDFDSTGKGDKKAEVLADPIDDLRRDHHHALADITGKSRSTVELI